MRNLYLLILFHLAFSLTTYAQTYDWLRSNVNEFWFNQFVGRCDDNSKQVGRPSISVDKECSCAPGEIIDTQVLGKEIMSGLYFNEALIEQAKQNQCQFDYWSALNTKNSDNYAKQSTANAKLANQFRGVGDVLKSHGFNQRNSVFGETTANTANDAQKKIVDQLVDSAARIAEKKRELKHFQAKNSLYPVVPNPNIKKTVEKLENEIALLESSFLFSEDAEVSTFVKYRMVSKINESYEQGKSPNINELKNFFLNDASNSFQSQVVDRKMSSIANEQKNYSDINGKYNENYSFKVATVQSGVGAQVLKNILNQNPHYAQIQCDLDSKYGKGEEIASTANTVVIAGVTIFVGGASLMLARLAQIGMTSYRAARVGQIISIAVNATISTSELTKMIVESCSEPHFTKKESTICSRVDSLKDGGLIAQIASEIEHSECLTDLGLSALSGAASLKSMAKAKRLKRERQIADLGLKDKYQSIISRIEADPRLSAEQKKQLRKELERSVSLSDMDSFPRKEFLDSIAKENPEDLLVTLKQINGDTGGLTWKERVKNWINGKGFTKEEAAQLEGCLVDGASKTSSCSMLDKKSDS